MNILEILSTEFVLKEAFPFPVMVVRSPHVVPHNRELAGLLNVTLMDTEALEGDIINQDEDFRARFMVSVRNPGLDKQIRFTDVYVRFRKGTFAKPVPPSYFHFPELTLSEPKTITVKFHAFPVEDVGPINPDQPEQFAWATISGVFDPSSLLYAKRSVGGFSTEIQGPA